MTETLLDQVLIGRTPDGSRVRVTVELKDLHGGWDIDTTETVEHAEIGPFRRLSISALGYSKHRRVADSAGQIIDMAELVAHGGEVASGLRRQDVARLVEIWREWHLNDMTAGCAHQTPPVGSTLSERLDQTPPCPVTGYRFGSKWLVRPLPEALVTELRELCANLENGSGSH